MATHIGIGFSQDIDAQTAAKDAGFESKTNLGADRIDIAIVFSTVHYNPSQTVPVLRTVLNQAKMIGCSTAGIILSNTIETHGVAVLTISSDELAFGIGSAENLDTQDALLAGNFLARNALKDFGPRSRQAFMFFVDGKLENNSVLLKGIQDIFGSVFPVLGAGSCDDFHFANTFQIHQDNILTNAATGLIIGGQTSIGIGCCHGGRPLGKPRVIDRAEGNAIYSIDDKKASSIYEEYFGEQVDDLRSNQFDRLSILYPLGIFVDGSREYLLRNVTNIREDGSIICQGHVPEGSEVHIMIGNKDSCKQAAVQAAQDAKANLRGRKAKLVVVFESMARLKLLGRAAHEETDSIRNVFGAGIPIVGMYSNGEICPFQTVEKFKKPYLLNGTIVVWAVS
ncbi:MAG: hypothetical protein A3C36_03440 [Omnitrophica WOR_2 bacterium RIFCSPHIGHO2_02_FULL_52_10]|nr:MAG: hypothetical protein A3C36_03440 [Omnitrophica WOR_2 bacterium RIFCSPHIGHO2_02_FULL_52_10]